MRLLNQYIIEFDFVHKTSTEVGGYKIDINPMFEQQKWINRVGRIIETPLSVKSPIKKGYEVLVVHTILLEEVIPKKGRVINNFLVDEEKNWFQFEDNLIVMYRPDSNSEWKCHLESIMVEPIVVTQERKEVGGLTLPDSVFEAELGYKGNELQRGIIRYGNEGLSDIGVSVGDEIIFKKNREYEFDLEGKIYWHMENCDILMHKVDLSKNEPELSDCFC